ncbi:hypothetical protein ROHU_020029 [Labeo rohita]|uniref:Uncharacterized protein n=1 Tax=Labeo rohita TaxID=84645 RepID=A0A498L6Q4_LABRO|nr:hypothetical protein ROHU_034276 [Labeo rohita]RXN27432.1 hypothetical protein ROHU_020029 [Labeo rohita]
MQGAGRRGYKGERRYDSVASADPWLPPHVYASSRLAPVLELGQTKLFVLPLRDTSQRTGSTAAQPGAGGPSGSRWLSKKQTLEESGKSVKADTTLPIRLKTHWRMQRADKGQGSNGPITSWLLFR